MLLYSKLRLFDIQVFPANFFIVNFFITCVNKESNHIFTVQIIFLSDLTDLEVDFHSLLLYVLIIWQSTHNLASIESIKWPSLLKFKLW